MLNGTVLIWHTNKTSENRWYKGVVQLGDVGYYRIILEGIQGGDPTSHIAIDDIRIFSGNCEGKV